jgi:hypothetical protein
MNQPLKNEVEEAVEAQVLRSSSQVNHLHGAQDVMLGCLLVSQRNLTFLLALPQLQWISDDKWSLGYLVGNKRYHLCHGRIVGCGRVGRNRGL